MNNRPSSVTAQPERRAGHASRKKKLQKAKRRARLAKVDAGENSTITPAHASAPKMQKESANREFIGWFTGSMMPGKYSPRRKFRMASLRSNGKLSGESVFIYAKTEGAAQIMRDATDGQSVTITGAIPATGKPFLTTGDGFMVRVGALNARELRIGVNTSKGGRYAHEWGYVK